MESFKTFFLLTALTLLFVWIGFMVGGQSGMLIAFALAVGMNFFSYFYSDKLVLKHYRAVEVGASEAPGFYAIVERLANKANLPMPKVYIIPDRTPNAFATGRSPNHAAVAATEGLLDLLTEEEIEGVMAHELSHVRHYDILIGTVAATIAGAISIVANFLQFGAMFGNNREGGGAGNIIIMLLLSIVMPLAAMVIQMAVSRSREYMADEGAARITGHPEWLQSALTKLENYNRGGMVHEATEATAHMFIINPFSGKNVSFRSLFSTHPSTQSRIEKLEQLKGRV